MFIPGPNFFRPESRVKKALDPDPQQKIVTKLSENVSLMFIPDPDFFLFPDPGVKKALDPGSELTTLQSRVRY
jgi:hypothetical protein